MNWVWDISCLRYNLKLWFFKSLLVIWNSITHKVCCCKFVMFYASFVCAHCCVDFVYVFLGFDYCCLQVNRSFGLEVRHHFKAIYIIWFMCVWTTIIFIGIKMVARDKGCIICKGWWLKFQQSFCNIIFRGYLCPLAPCETLPKVVFGPFDVKSLLVCNQWHQVVCWHESDVLKRFTSHLT